MDLKTLLLTVVAGLPLGALEYLGLSKWPWYWNLAADTKRLVAAGISAALALGAWALATWVFMYLPMPPTVVAGIEQAAGVVIQVGFAVFGTATLAHTRELKR